MVMTNIRTYKVNTIIIVQARMTSTRLPGKVLMPVHGKPLLEHQLERLALVTKASHIVVATTINKTDDPICQLCEKLNIPFFRGSEPDVLSRYYYAAKELKADVVVRVTADCPLIDPRIIDRVITSYLENIDNLDYASNCHVRSYPRGMDAEVFSFLRLEQAQFCSVSNFEREHVTPFITTRSPAAKLLDVVYEGPNLSAHRWTVDTQEDFTLIKHLLDVILDKGVNYSMSDVIDLLNRNPDWSKINAHIEQKHK